MNIVVSPESLPGSYKLVDFVRDHALLKGTKSMCREGGCGICTVTVKRPSCKTEEPVNSVSITVQELFVYTIFSSVSPWLVLGA